MNSREQVASRLVASRLVASRLVASRLVASRLVASRFLDSISESLSIEPNKLARMEGQFIAPNGLHVYPVRHSGKTAYVTIPED